jgi:imidazolonepropionase
LNHLGSAQKGAQLGARAISHLEKVRICIQPSTSNENFFFCQVDEAGIIAMSQCKPHPTVAVLLPTTAYVLRLEYPPARKFIENSVPVALGSDFNPNAHCMSMPQV